MYKFYAITLVIFFVNLQFIKAGVLKVHDDKLTKISIDVTQNNGSYNIADDIEPEYDIIALETNDNCLLGRIKKILFENTRYYIQDDQLKCIYIFGADGKFISKLDKQGAGPDEYATISTFTIKGHDIWIHDDARGLLICYDKEYNKTKQIELYFPSNDMTFIGNDIFVATNSMWHGPQSHQLAKIDLGSESIFKAIPIPESDSKDYIPVLRNNLFAQVGNSSLRQTPHLYPDQ